ncbi:MAG: hypothetical protein ACYDD0_11680, partial [Candidatus Dormibacteria bacterium]
MGDAVWVGDVLDVPRQTVGRWRRSARLKAGNLDRGFPAALVNWGSPESALRCHATLPAIAG